MKIESIKGYGDHGVSITGIKYPFVQDQIDELRKLIREESIIVLPQIHFSKEQFYELATLLGAVYNEKEEYEDSIPYEHQFGYYDNNGYPLLPGMQIVQARKIAGKYKGIAPGITRRLNWHNNESERDSVRYKKIYPKGALFGGRNPFTDNQDKVNVLPDVVGLQGVKGTIGTITQVCQFIDKFKLETPETQDKFRNMIIQWGFVPGDEGIYPDAVNDQDDQHNEDNLDKQLPLIFQTAGGEEGLHYSPSQVTGIVGESKETYEEFKEYMHNEYMTDTYIYNHEWKDGDIFFMDQRVSVHRRTDKYLDVSGLDMKYLEQRLLHRIELHLDSQIELVMLGSNAGKVK